MKDSARVVVPVLLFAAQNQLICTAIQITRYMLKLWLCLMNINHYKIQYFYK